MSGNAAGEIAAAIGKKWHRVVVVAEIRIAYKRAVFLVEDVIHAAVKLVLLVRLYAGEYEVVCRGCIGRRIMLQHLRCKRIEAGRRDRVVGERRSGRTCRIVNRGGEHATALGHRGHDALAGDSGSQPGALPVRKEERLIPADRSAYRQPVLVSPKFRPRAGLRKIVPGVQIFVAKELKKRPVELVAAGFPDHHDRSPIGSTIFRRVSIDVQLKFLHSVDDRIESHLTRLRLQNADSVVEVFVGTRPASVDPRQQRPSTRQGDAR